MEPTKIIQTYYLSIGRQEVYHTLWWRRDVVGGDPSLARFMPDHYICNLATDADRAVEKAREHFAALRERMGPDTEHRVMLLDECPYDETYRRRGKLSARDSRSLDAVEQGLVPFGKNQGRVIADMEEGWLLFWADKLATLDEGEFGARALASACQGVALEKGHIARRQERRDAQAQQDALSSHVGAVGERREFEGVLYSSFFKGDDPAGLNRQAFGYWINKVRAGNDIVVYLGNKPLAGNSRKDHAGDEYWTAAPGARVRFRATVKRHDEYKGVKTTKVGRPSNVEVVDVEFEARHDVTVGG